MTIERILRIIELPVCTSLSTDMIMFILELGLRITCLDTGMSVDVKIERFHTSDTFLAISLITMIFRLTDCSVHIDGMIFVPIVFVMFLIISIFMFFKFLKIINPIEPFN